MNLFDVLSQGPIVATFRYDDGVSLESRFQRNEMIIVIWDKKADMLRAISLMRDELDKQGGIQSFRFRKEESYIRSPHETMWDVEQKGLNLISWVLYDEELY